MRWMFGRRLNLGLLNQVTPDCPVPLRLLSRRYGRMR